MKRSIQLCAVVVAWSATSLFAQPPGGGGGPPRGGVRPPLIQALDADGDGVISAEEIKNAPAALAALDKNKDGKLTEDEYRPQGGRPGAGPGGPGEGGGEGRPERVPAGPGGGEAGRPERRNPEGRNPEGGGPGGRNAEGGPPGPNPERMVEHAMEFDADKDGKLSREELMKFAEDFAKHRPAPGGGPPRGNPGGPENNSGEGGRSERPRRPE